MFKRKQNNNTYTDKGEYFEVTVKNSDIVYVVDAEDVNWMKGYTWYTDKAHGMKYPYLSAKKRLDTVKYERKEIKIHVEIMREEIERFKIDNPGYRKRIIIDHIDGDISNNRKENLRVRTQSENNMNKKVQSNNTTGFVGVTWHSKQKMWNAMIDYEDERIELGSFYYLRNAMRARVEAEKKYFGEHAFYTRDESYRERVDELLSLPRKPEPVITPRYKTKTGYIGVGFYDGRYRTSFKKKSKEFKTLEEAVDYRRELWIKEYGDRPMMHTDEKKEKQI